MRGDCETIKHDSSGRNKESCSVLQKALTWSAIKISNEPDGDLEKPTFVLFYIPLIPRTAASANQLPTKLTRLIDSNLWQILHCNRERSNIRCRYVDRRGTRDVQLTRARLFFPFDSLQTVINSQQRPINFLINHFNIFFFFFFDWISDSDFSFSFLLFIHVPAVRFFVVSASISRSPKCSRAYCFRRSPHKLSRLDCVLNATLFKNMQEVIVAATNWQSCWRAPRLLYYLKR